MEPKIVDTVANQEEAKEDQFKGVDENMELDET